LALDGWRQSPVVILIGDSTVMDVVILIRVGWKIDEMGCDSRVSELAVRRVREEGSGLGKATGINSGDEVVDSLREQHYRRAIEVARPGAVLP